MIRVGRCCLIGLIACVAGAAPAYAQLAAASASSPIAGPVGAPRLVADTAPGELHGTVRDEEGRPLGGAVVSALGSMSAFAISDREGRFAFRSLPAGPYLVRVHREGYLPARGRIVQVSPGTRRSSTIALTRRADADDADPPVLEAGIGAGSRTAVDSEAPDAEHEHDEVSWRLRHVKRSVLKEAEHAIAELGQDDRSFVGDSLAGLGMAVGGPARLATALFSELPLSGEINLLTTTSFDRPQDLFAIDALAPRGVAYLSLETDGIDGSWRIRGTITQGDVASWMLAASYMRRASAAHRYEAGVSYSTQRYLGGNLEALAAIRDGGRNVGSMYAYDDWAVAPRVRVGYGAKYATHDYLDDRHLLSPRASVTVQPFASDSLRLHATMAHREIAPGAEEFLPPTIGLWLPPERTFSHVSRGAFRPERLDRVELGAEREWPGAFVIGLRTFTERVDDQLITLFGVAVAGAADDIGHYRVASAGDYEARGWGVSVSRDVTEGLRAAVAYTMVGSERRAASPDAEALAPLVGDGPAEVSARIHDVTASVESLLPRTATRIFVLYKLNSAFASEASPLATARFNVQVNQALPFMSFSAAQWELLVAVSNLFREQIDGSVYDELMVIRPPKRVLGGVTVRF